MKHLESFNSYNTLNESIYDVFKNKDTLPEIKTLEEAEELINKKILDFKFMDFIISIDLEKLTMAIIKATPKAKYSGYKLVQNYRYSKPERIIGAIKEFMDKEYSWIKRKEDEKSLKQKHRAEMKNPYNVGDILYDSWGYDQTNVNFYQITNVSDKSVYIRPIAQDIVKGTEGHDSSNVKPIKDDFIGDEIRKTLVVTSWSETPRLSSEYGGALKLYTRGEKGVYSSSGH